MLAYIKILQDDAIDQFRYDVSWYIQAGGGPNPPKPPDILRPNGGFTKLRPTRVGISQGGKSK